LDSYPRPLRVFINDREQTRRAYNSPIPVVNYGGTPTDNYPLERCAGDCDNDGHCQNGLICHQNNNVPDETVPGCSQDSTSSTDYCVDPRDYTQGVLFLPTGGWDDDWLYSEPIEGTFSVTFLLCILATPYTHSPSSPRSGSCIWCKYHKASDPCRILTGAKR
jgi:hypothetical protein